MNRHLFYVNAYHALVTVSSNVLSAICYCLFTEISKVQDDEVGDGTTSVTILACELLKVSLLSFQFFML